MTYDITFLRKPDDRSWEDVLRHHDARIGEATALESIGQPMHARFEAVIHAIEDDESAGYRVSGNGFVELHDRPSGMQLHLFASEISLSSRLTSDRDEARAAAERMVVVARIVEEETGFQGYDQQIRARLLGLSDPICRVADEVVRLARRIDSALESGGYSMTWRRWRSLNG